MPLQAGATQDEDEGANAADCELAAALSWWSLYDAMRLYIFCARPHLPSGRYRRIVKGIFFSFSSFIAIWGERRGGCMCTSAAHALAGWALCRPAGWQQLLSSLVLITVLTRVCCCCSLQTGSGAMA